MNGPLLTANEITQVEGLEGLVYLQELVLDRNRIRALGESSFSGQGRLLELRLAENRLRELSNLHPLSRLRRLHLGVNKLQVRASACNCAFVYAAISQCLNKLFSLAIRLKIFFFLSSRKYMLVLSSCLLDE